MNNSISAEPGETVYSFLSRAQHEAWERSIYLKATHNDVSIFVHPNSCVEDLCDKYDLQRKIDRK